MRVEPVGEDPNVPLLVRKRAVPHTGLRNQLGLDAHRPEFLDDQLGLLDRNEFIGGAVNDERRRIVGADVSHGRDGAADLRDLRLVGDTLKRLRRRILLEKIEDRLVVFQETTAHCAHARRAVIQKVGRGPQDGHRLQATGGPLDGILGIRLPQIARHRLQQRKVSPRRRPVDPDVIRINLVVLRVVADVADPAVQIFDHIGNGVPRLAPMKDPEDCISPVGHGNDLRDPRLDLIEGRDPSPADYQDNPQPIGILARREDIHRQRGAERSAIDDVVLARKRRMVVRAANARHRKQEHAGTRRDRDSLSQVPTETAAGKLGLEREKSREGNGDHIL